MGFKKETADDLYRNIEAMYRRGVEPREISRSLGLGYIDVMDVYQRIFYNDERRKHSGRFKWNSKGECVNE